MNRSPRNPQTSTLAEILADPTTEWTDIREAIKTQGRGSFFGATTNASVIKALREHSAASNKETPERRTSSSCITVVTSNKDDGGGNGEFSGRLCDCEKEANCSVVAGDEGGDGGENSARCSHEIGVADAKSSDDGSAPENPARIRNMESNNKLSTVEEVISKLYEESTDAGSSGGGKGAAIEGENGSVAIKTELEDSSQRKELKVGGDNSLDGSKIECISSGKTARAPPPPRRLPRTSSKKGGPLRGSLLTYVMEDVEADNLNNDDSSSQLSGRGILPSRKKPLYAPGSFRKSKMGGSLPVRRLSRGNSAKGKGVSFRGSLKNVLEDKEAYVNDADADLGGESRPSETAPRGRRKTSLRQGRVQSLLSATSDDKSFRLCHSDTTSSSTSQRGGMYNESINIMDFGVDPNQRPFTESMLSLSLSSAKSPATEDDSMLSNLVDSKGFLGWGHDLSFNSASTRRRATADDSMSSLMDSKGSLGWDNDSSNSASTRSLDGALNKSNVGYRPMSKRGQPRGSESLDKSTSNFSNLVDSSGFLGWDDSQTCGDSSRCLGEENIEDEAEEKEPAETEKYGDNLDSFEKSWRIEDYENSADMIDHSQHTWRTGSGNILGKQMRRLSNKMTEGISARRNTWFVSEGVPTEIQTNDIKRILLEGASGSEPLSDANRAKDDAAVGTLKSIFSGRRGSSHVSSAPDPDDDYYSCAIRVDREDGINIGELRKELRMAAAGSAEGNNTNKNRLKMGFF